jgi:ABC-type enterochelin transport system substrate-binding protein
MTIQCSVLQIGNIIKTGLKYAASAQLIIHSPRAKKKKNKERKIRPKVLRLRISSFEMCYRAEPN